jgi:hypothetical protein
MHEEAPGRSAHSPLHPHQIVNGSIVTSYSSNIGDDETLEQRLHLEFMMIIR